jgi:uncharacterized coiled-coil protein SlyX
MGRFRLAPRRLRGARPQAVPPAALDALEARVAHLEGVIEGLQDAVYRHDRLHDQDIAELRRRTEPGQIARDLSRDARERGL